MPVVVLNSRGDNDPVAAFKARVAEMEAALDTERNAHGATKRILQEAQASVQALQTRLAHAEFAHGEALAAERRARRDAEDNLHARLALEAEQAAEPIGDAPAMAVVSTPKKTARKAPRVPRTPKIAEPQPVKWWLPNFREKAH